MPKAKTEKIIKNNQGKKLEERTKESKKQRSEKRESKRKEFITETGIFIRSDQPHDWTKNSNHIYWRYLYHIRQTIQNLENLFVEEKDPKYLFEVKHWQRLKDLLIYEGSNYTTITLEQATINISGTDYNEKLVKKPKQPKARPLWIDTSTKLIKTEPTSQKIKERSTSEEENDEIYLYITSNPASPTPSPTEPQGKSPEHPIQI